MAELEVLNPVAAIRGELNAREVSPRLTSLEGRTLGLLWSGTTNGDVALRRVEHASAGAISQYSNEVLPWRASVCRNLAARRSAGVRRGCDRDR